MGRRRSIDASLIAEIARTQLPEGAKVSAAVLGPGNVLIEFADAAGQLMPIYSLTKTFIAALVLRAAEQRLLTLDDLLARYAPDVPKGEHIHICQLLNHTAGLPDYGALEAYQRAVMTRAEPWTDDQFADHTYRKGFDRTPAAAWSYSNPGYALLVRILENVHSNTLPNIVREQITQILELADTRVASSLAEADIVASTSRSLSADNQDLDVGTHYRVGWVWHRLIVSTAKDVARFLYAVFDGTLLTADSLATMTTLVNVPVDHPLWQAPKYGCGLMCETMGPRSAMYGHNGDGPGYCASGFFFAERRITIAVTATCENSDHTLRMVHELYDRV